MEQCCIKHLTISTVTQDSFYCARITEDMISSKVKSLNINTFDICVFACIWIQISSVFKKRYSVCNVVQHMIDEDTHSADFHLQLTKEHATS